MPSTDLSRGHAELSPFLALGRCLRLQSAGRDLEALDVAHASDCQTSQGLHNEVSSWSGVWLVRVGGIVNNVGRALTMPGCRPFGRFAGFNGEREGDAAPLRLDLRSSDVRSHRPRTRRCLLKFGAHLLS